MESQDSAAIVRAGYDAFNDRNFDRIDALVSEDFELVDFAADRQTFRGPQGFREWHQIFLTAFPDAKVELTNVVGAGEEGWVFIGQTGRGTQTGPLVGPSGTIPPTGRSIELPIGQLFRVENGKIALMHAYYDGATLMRQLGEFPPRPEVLARILIYQAKKLRSWVRERR